MDWVAQDDAWVALTTDEMRLSSEAMAHFPSEQTALIEGGARGGGGGRNGGRGEGWIRVWRGETSEKR